MDSSREPAGVPIGTKPAEEDVRWLKRNGSEQGTSLEGYGDQRQPNQCRHRNHREIANHRGLFAAPRLCL